MAKRRRSSGPGAKLEEHQSSVIDNPHGYSQAMLKQFVTAGLDPARVVPSAETDGDDGGSAGLGHFPHARLPARYYSLYSDAAGGKAGEEEDEEVEDAHQQRDEVVRNDNTAASGTGAGTTAETDAAITAATATTHGTAAPQPAVPFLPFIRRRKGPGPHGSSSVAAVTAAAFPGTNTSMDMNSANSTSGSRRYVLAAAVRAYLLQGHVRRARDAFALLLSDGGGIGDNDASGTATVTMRDDAVDIRDLELWRLGVEILLRDGEEDVTTSAQQQPVQLSLHDRIEACRLRNLPAAVAFLETLSRRHPCRGLARYVTSGRPDARHFAEAAFALEAWGLWAEERLERRRILREGDTRGRRQGRGDQQGGDGQSSAAWEAEEDDRSDDDYDADNNYQHYHHDVMGSSSPPDFSYRTPPSNLHRYDSPAFSSPYHRRHQAHNSGGPRQDTTVTAALTALKTRMLARTTALAARMDALLISDESGPGKRRNPHATYPPLLRTRADVALFAGDLVAALACRESRLDRRGDRDDDIDVEESSDTDEDEGEERGESNENMERWRAERRRARTLLRRYVELGGYLEPWMARLLNTDDGVAQWREGRDRASVKYGWSEGDNGRQQRDRGEGDHARGQREETMEVQDTGGLGSVGRRRGVGWDGMGGE